MFNKILVPIDIQRVAASTKILNVAEQFAQQFGSAVHVTTVMPGYGMPIVATYFPADAKATAKREIEAKLESMVVGKFSGKVTTSVSEGKRAEEILKTAKRRKSDLILIGCHKHGKLEDSILGSCGTKIAQRATCSVIVLRSG